MRPFARYRVARHPAGGQPHEPRRHPRARRAPAAGGVIQYRHDAAGRISGLTWDGQPVADQLQYTASGAVSALRLANGLTHQRRYDTAGRLKSYTLTNDVHQLAYDAAGQLITLTPPDPDGQRQYRYDAAGRLTGYQGPAHSESYTYDPGGNRLARTRNGQTTAYGYLPASNRLQSVDAAGNLALDPARQYTHDSRGRLAQLTRGATLARYEYNGLGERVLTQLGPELRHFVYGDAGQLLGEYDSAGRPLAEYAWLGGLPVAYRLHRTVDGLARTELYAVEADHLGTPRALTDAAQRLRWRWTSDPFGDTPPDENPEGLVSITFNLRFPGQYYDAESDLHYNYFRDYDPAIGRYAQSDPIGLLSGINTYDYALNNPILVYDPFGLEPNPTCVAACTIGGGVIGGAAGYVGGGIVGGAIGGFVGSALGLGGTVAGGATGASEGSTAGGAAGAAGGATVGNAVGETFCPEEECDPPAGTLCSEFHIGGVPHKTKDIDGNNIGKMQEHVHIWKMNKAPTSCYWNKR